MHKLKVMLISYLCTVIAAIVYFNVGTNCLSMIYEPKYQNILRDKL